MEPIGCPRKSVWSYHSALRKIPEQRRALIQRWLNGGKSTRTDPFPGFRSPVSISERVLFVITCEGKGNVKVRRRIGHEDPERM
jgi:hypothetical protein